MELHFRSAGGRARRRGVLNLGHEPAPDDTTICKFRPLLERHDLGQSIFERVGVHLQAKRFRLSTGTIDATLVAAPSSI